MRFSPLEFHPNSTLRRRVYPTQNKEVQPSKGQYGHVTDVAKLYPPARGEKAFFNFQFSIFNFHLF
jgi:hypothetical protein